MTLAPAFKTLSVKVPTALAARVDGYTLAHNDTVSGFIKTAILRALGDYQCDTPIPMEVSKAEADAVISKVGKVLAATPSMLPAKRANTLGILLTVVSNAKEHFNMVAATDARYAGSYKSLMLQVRNAHRAAETKALITPEAVTPTDAPTVRKLKDIPKYREYTESAKSLYDVTPGELEALGFPESLRESNLHLDVREESKILAGINWMRGNVFSYRLMDPNWMPPKGSPEAEAELALMVERHQAMVNENHQKASPATLAHLLKYQAHLASPTN